MKKITGVPGFFGETLHYDEHGNKVGETWNTGLFGQDCHYDASGNKVGETWDTGLFGQDCHYDTSGNKVAETYDGLICDKITYGDGFRAESWNLPFHDEHTFFEDK